MKNRIVSTLVLALAAAMLSSCGGKNTSGGGSTTDILGGGTVIQGGNGQVLPGNWREIIKQENPCRDGSGGMHQNRQSATIPVQTHTNVGAIHVGVTSMGDVAYVSNNGGSTNLTIEICQRPGMAPTGHQFGNMILNMSQTCPVAEITQAYAVLSGQVPYEIVFRPIHIPQGGVMSSLCQQQQYPMY